MKTTFISARDRPQRARAGAGNSSDDFISYIILLLKYESPFILS